MAGRSRPPPKDYDDCKVFVECVGQQTSAADLRAYFSKFGRVKGGNAMGSGLNFFILLPIC